MEIVELRSEREVAEAFPVVRELHGELDRPRYEDLLSEMRPNGYRKFAVRDGGWLTVVAGVKVMTNVD